MTTSLFNTETGVFDFTSSDLLYFGTQTITLTITGTVGESTESFTVALNLINPCSVATFDINPSIISEEIVYNVYPYNDAYEKTLNSSMITQSLTSTRCPSIEINIVNEDGSSLSEPFLNYNINTYKFRI